MCLGNFEPIDIPQFDYNYPDENYKGKCDYLEQDELDSLSPNTSDYRVLHLNI